MTTEATDVHRPLVLRSERALRRFLPLALLVCLIGLTMLVFEASGNRKDLMRGWLVLGAGLAWAAYVLIRQVSPGRPAVVVSADGIHFAIPNLKAFFLPWSEVQTIATVDLSERRGVYFLFGNIGLRGMPAALVSTSFYKEHVGIGFTTSIGAGLLDTFIPLRNTVQVVFHPTLYGMPLETFREGLEARWRAFGNRAPRSGEWRTRPPDASAHSTPPIRSAVARRSGGIVVSAWEFVSLAVPLTAIVAVLANALGVWETSGQQARRIERERKAEIARKERDEERKRKEKWEKIWSDFDKTFKRFESK